MKYQGLDLYTLEFVEAMFTYYSDHSTKCQGYAHLKSLIRKAKKFNSNERETVRKHEQKKKPYVLTHTPVDKLTSKPPKFGNNGTIM